MDAHPPGDACCAQEDHPAFSRGDLFRILFVGASLVAMWRLHGEPYGAADIAGLVLTVVGAWPLFRQSALDLLSLRMTMELSMVIALVAALAIHESVTALVITFFVLGAESIERLTIRRGRGAMRDLLTLMPQRAVLHEGGAEREVPASELRAGDVVLVKPGARIPADGVVAEGGSFVDQSMITGESMPAEKSPGAFVYAGSLNQSGVLDVRVTHVGRDTAFGKILDAVERAERSRAPVQRTADRFAAWLVAFAIGCAAVTYVVTGWNLRAAIAVVIVAGACGVAAGTPLAILGAIGQAARKGTIIKGGLYLETLACVDVVVLDKTGTLTLGTPEVTAISPCAGASEDAVLRAAAAAERHSEHPLGRAILRRAGMRGLAVEEPEGFEYTPGKGIVCRAGGEEIVVGNRALFAERGLVGGGPVATGAHESEVLVGRGGRLIGALRVADVVRPEAAAAMRALRDMGIRTILLTGDAESIAREVAVTLGVDEAHAGLLPDQKLARVRELVEAGRTVAMLGDGINDAPALTQASVGVAMGSGTDVARESADVVLVDNDLLKFVDTLRIARKCRGIIWFNFAGTLAVDVVGMGLSAAAMLPPVAAAFIHVSSELAFLMNSARLLPSLRGR